MPVESTAISGVGDSSGDSLGSEWTLLHHCPLCAGSAFRTVCEARDRHYNIKGKYTLVQCVGCGLIFLNPLPSEQALTRLYPDTYYAYQDVAARKNRLKQRVKRLLGVNIGTKDPQFAAPGRILDLGCGSGWFLQSARERGWETHGVEVSVSAAELGRKTANLDIFAGTLCAAGFPNDHFDYIRSNHSFEHIVDPNATLQEIHRILKPDGKLMIGVPNIDGWNSRVFKDYWWYLGAPVHPFSYSVQTLSRMLEKHRFVVERVTYNSDYSGILGSMQIYANRHTDRISTEGMLMPNFGLVVVAQRMAKLLDLFKLGDAIEITCRKA